MKTSGVFARVLLGLHLAGGLLLSLLGTGAVAAALLAGREVSMGLFLAFALPGIALGLLPSSTTMLACGVLFGWLGAIALYPGLVLAALPGFFVIRRYFRDDARMFLARHPSAQGIVGRLERRTFSVATLIRIAPISTFAWTNAVLSASSIKTSSYIASTGLGLLPRLVLLTWAGSSAGSIAQALRGGPGGTAAIVGLSFSVVSLVLLAWYATRLVGESESD